MKFAVADSQRQNLAVVLVLVAVSKSVKGCLYNFS